MNEWWITMNSISDILLCMKIGFKHFHFSTNQSPMNKVSGLSVFIFCLISLIPQQISAAIARQETTVIVNDEHLETSDGRSSNWHHFKTKLEKRVGSFKSKIKRWISKAVFQLPTGNLLTSLVLLIGAIALFAIGGVTKFGLIFGILGSVAVIGALIFFMLWLGDKSKSYTPASD